LINSKFCPLIQVFNIIFSGLLFFGFKDIFGYPQMIFYFRYNQLIREYNKKVYFETICYALEDATKFTEKNLVYGMFSSFNVEKFSYCSERNAFKIIIT